MFWAMLFCVSLMSFFVISKHPVAYLQYTAILMETPRVL